MSTRGQKETFLFFFLLFSVVNPGHALLREAAERERERERERESHAWKIGKIRPFFCEP